MPINVTDPNSKKISLQVFTIKILVFTYISSLNFQILPVFHFGCHEWGIRTGHTKNSKLSAYNMMSRLRKKLDILQLCRKWECICDGI